MKRNLYYWIGLLAILFTVSCEDLDETYDEFAGDGRIRYLGKCSDVEVQPGWQRVRVSWKNNIDAAVKYTKITWKAESDDEPFVQLVERPEVVGGMDLMDTIYLENLQDAVYTITVSNISADSTESLVETQYARPYTENHEDLNSFTRGIINFYRLDGDKMAVLLDEDNENLKEMTLTYWGSDNQLHEWDIKEHMTDSVPVMPGMEDMLGYSMRRAMQLLPDENGISIDFAKPLVIKRIGNLPECIDEITFKDDTLSLDEQILSVTFTRWLEKEYGPDWRSKDVLNKIETVEFDYDMSTMQDLFYLPNLKKVILGKNRFMWEGHTDENLSATSNDYNSLMTLQFLKNTRNGFTVERYNAQYFHEVCTSEMVAGMSLLDVLQMAGELDYDLLSNKNDNLSLMPVITPLDASDWVVTCSDTTYNGNKKYGAGLLLDDDPTTYFEPGQDLASTVYEVKIDMKKAQTLHGFKVSQPQREPANEDDLAVELGYLLGSLQIEVSEDGYVWLPATYEEGGTTIGDALGEITFIKVPEEYQSRQVRYIRLTMVSRNTGALNGGVPTFSLRLGDFVPY